MPRRARKLTPLSRRLRYGRRQALWVLLAAALASVLYVGDREGFFGERPRPDYEKYHNQTFRVVRVVDGDTIDLDVSDGSQPRTRVRLWGVDTPETVKPNTPPQHYGKQATAATTRLCLDKSVRLELVPHQDTRDRYGRLLAYIHLGDGTMLNRALVEQGFAYADYRFPHPHKEEFLRLQDQARQGKLGLWREVRQRDLPHYWREKIKLEK